MLRILTWSLVKPTLGFAAISVCAIYAFLYVASALSRPHGDTFWLLAPVPLFWISLRVLLTVANPPKGLWRSIVFALLLLNLLFSSYGLFVLAMNLYDVATHE